MTLDTSALIGAAGLMSSRMAELWKGYENVDISKPNIGTFHKEEKEENCFPSFFVGG